MAEVTATKGTTGAEGAAFRPRSAPFLVWPVSRREFYRTICVALVPALIWGVVLFGGRVLAMLALAVAASSLTCVVLKSVLRWRRAKTMLYVHCVLSDLVLVALAHPTWPVWFVAVLAGVMPAVLVVLGGSGKERVHLAAVLALAAPYFMQAAMAPTMYTGQPDAVLARDRLVLGDVQYQAGDFTASRTWPMARELGGHDAVTYRPPAVVAGETLDAVAKALPTREGMPAGRLPDALNKAEEAKMRGIMDRALALGLPRVDWLWLGVAPNRVGAASVIGLIVAGLYLSYRYILRPRSVTLFVVCYVLATAALMFTPATLERTGVPVAWEVLKTFPGEMLTLFTFLVVNSDLAFAAVIILALPGTEPLTPRGRRVFLGMAAMMAALVHRLDPTTPAATLALCVLMPAAPVFDRVLRQRSWVNGAKE